MKFLTIKHTVPLLLALAMLLAFASCDTAAGPEEPATTEPDTGTAAPTEATTPAETEPPEPASLTISDPGVPDCRIVVVRNARPSVVSAARMLRQKINDLCGMELTIGPGASPIGNERSYISIGITNLPEEAEFRAELTRAGTYAFGYRFTENGIIITATHEDLTQIAVEHFVQHCLTADGTFSVRPGEQISILTAPPVIVTGTKSDLTELMPDHLYATLSERVGGVPKSGNFKALQGGTATADYAWFAMINTADYDTKAAGVWIYKLDAKTWKVIKKSEVLMLDHANDITYIPQTNEIAVAHCYVDSQKATFLNADTLTVTRVLRSNTKGFYALAYNADRDEFIGGTGKANMNKYSGNLTFKQYYEGTGTQLTTQGIYCDNNYIYHILYSSGLKDEPDNMIFVNRYDNGQKVAKIRLSISGQEPENLSIVNGAFIIGCNSSNAAEVDIYRTEVIDFGPAD